MNLVLVSRARQDQLGQEDPLALQVNKDRKVCLDELDSKVLRVTLDSPVLLDSREYKAFPVLKDQVVLPDLKVHREILVNKVFKDFRVKMDSKDPQEQLVREEILVSLKYQLNILLPKHY